MFRKMERLTVRRILLLLALGVGLIVLLDVGCVFRRITGIPCPGCGMTRAYRAAMRLDFRAAFFFHPLWFLVMPLFAVQVFFPQGLFRSKKANTVCSFFLLALILGVYAVRMLLYFPDRPPMEYAPNNLLRWVAIRLGLLS